MAKFVDTNEFRSLNVGFALDEGIACTDDVIPLFYAERSVWRQYIFIIIKYSQLILNYVVNNMRIT